MTRWVWNNKQQAVSKMTVLLVFESVHKSNSQKRSKWVPCAAKVWKKKRVRTSHIIKKHLQRWKWQRAPTRESHTSVTNARACKISSQLPGFTVISIHWPEWMRVIAGKMAWLSQSKLLSFQPSSRESHWHVNSRQKKEREKETRKALTQKSLTCKYQQREMKEKRGKMIREG